MVNGFLKLKLVLKLRGHLTGISAFSLPNFQYIVKIFPISNAIHEQFRIKTPISFT